MKSHIKKETLKISENKLSLIVRDQFREFLKYVDYPEIEFPSNIEMCFYNGFDKSTSNRGQVFVPYKENEKYKLTLEQFDCLKPSQEVLFHEFTHIMDTLVINNELSFDDRVKYLREISEIRATYIEYSVRANINKYNSTAMFDENYEIFSAVKYKNIKISDEIKLYNEHILNLINGIDEYNAKSFNRLTTNLFYYIGFIIFIEKHTGTLIDYSFIKKTVAEILGDDFISLFDIKNMIPLDFSPINFDILKTIDNLYDSAKEFFIQKYINPENK